MHLTTGNTAGAQLYRALGLRRVRLAPHYYEDGGDGFLMVRAIQSLITATVPTGATTGSCSSWCAKAILCGCSRSVNSAAFHRIEFLDLTGFVSARW